MSILLEGVNTSGSFGQIDSSCKTIVLKDLNCINVNDLQVILVLRNQTTQNSDRNILFVTFIDNRIAILEWVCSQSNLIKVQVNRTTLSGCRTDKLDNCWRSLEVRGYVIVVIIKESCNVKVLSGVTETNNLEGCQTTRGTSLCNSTSIELEGRWAESSRS